MKQLLIIVEDDKSLNQGLCKALADQNRQVISCQNIHAAREQLALGGAALVLLDINLPDGNGLDFLQEIKAASPSLPVIMLTANDTDMDIVEGLEKGADDYITKPFSLSCAHASMQDCAKPQTAQTSKSLKMANSGSTLTTCILP